MAQVYPFRAFRYPPAQASFDRVLTQPYDKISPAMQEKYYPGDPHNLITVEKGPAFPGDSPKTTFCPRAAPSLHGWIANHIGGKDPAPAFSAYTQESTVPGGNDRRTRR